MAVKTEETNVGPILIGIGAVGLAGLAIYNFVIKKPTAQKYQLTIASGPNGTTDPAPGTYKYAYHAQVVVLAYADQGYKFDQWTGDVPLGMDPTMNPMSLEMTKDKSLTAHFVVNPSPEQYAVTFQAQAGGTIIPSGTHSYEQNSYVTVQATPNTGYKFVGWSGDWTGTDNPTQVQVTRDNMVVKANFTPIQQNGVQLVAGLNPAITYGGKTGTPQIVMASILPYAEPYVPAGYRPLLWIFRNGVWYCWHPTTTDIYDQCCPNSAWDGLTTVYNGDLCYVIVTQACFWTWP
jgi:uncharacterized repeat protein (TIGR02543 family)